MKYPLRGYLKSVGLTKNAYFSLLIYAKQHLLATCCDTTAGIGSVMGRMDGTDNAIRTDRCED